MISVLLLVHLLPKALITIYSYKWNLDSSLVCMSLNNYTVNINSMNYIVKRYLRVIAQHLAS